MSDTRKTAKFLATGGPITVTLSNGLANAGSYALRLWGKSTTKPEIDERGVFKDGDPPSIELPQDANKSNSANAGAMVDAWVEVIAVPPQTDYFVTLDASQDGNILTQLIASGTVVNSVQSVRLQILFEEASA